MGQKVILVADDNERIRKAACAMLIASEGLAECIEAENGLVAVQFTIERKPDLVILDYSMPVMDGFEAAKRIHEAFTRDANRALQLVRNPCGTGTRVCGHRSEGKSRQHPAAHGACTAQPTLNSQAETGLSQSGSRAFQLLF